MNKLVTKIATLSVGLAMAAGVGIALGQNNVVRADATDLTFDLTKFNGKGTANTGSEMSATDGDITLTFSKGYGVSSTDIRSYAGGTLTFSGATITALDITATDSANNRNGGSWTANDGDDPTLNSTKITWSGSSTELVLTHSSQFRPASIVITYTSGGGGGGGGGYEEVTYTLDSSSTPFNGTDKHTDVQEKTVGGITYQNVGGYNYNTYLALNYPVDSYLANKTPFPKNIKKIVVTYSANVTSYVKMYESALPATKTTLVSGSGTTSVTYTFSNTTQFFRLNMDTSTPKGTYCNISSLVVTLGSDAASVDLEDISLNGNVSIPVGLTYASQLTKDPVNANAKDAISWVSSNTAVATVDASGVVTGVAAGSATITATATQLSGVSASYTIQVFNVANNIERLYYQSSGDSLDLYGYYVGFLTGTGPVIMDGEFGVVLYNRDLDVSGYTAHETLLHVTGKLTIFSGLYEVQNPVVEVETDTTKAATPVVYSVTGGETYIHESRETLVSGTVVSVSGSWTTDTTIVVDVNGHNIQCFAKANAIDAETGAKIVADAEVTLTGFTGWHNQFQVTVTGLVETGTYTLSQFVTEFLTLTSNVCGESWTERTNNKSALQTNVWNVLNTAEKYGALSSEDKAALRTTTPEVGSDLEKALNRYDFLVGKYFGAAGDFLGRGIDFANASIVVFNVTDSTNGAIIFITAIAAVATASGLFFFIRRRKER